jgi:hypothetical protein
VSEPTSEAPAPGTSTPPRIPGERRLAHPPSDRYRVAEPPPAATDASASAFRGLVVGSVAAVVGAGAIVALGGVLAVSSGLIVAAAATGWAVGVAIKTGAGDRLAPGRRVRAAIGLALVAVTVGQLGLWLYSRSEGGVLGPVDYLAEVFGFLVPVEFVAAWTAAWVTAR